VSAARGAFLFCGAMCWCLCVCWVSKKCSISSPCGGADEKSLLSSFRFGPSKKTSCQMTILLIDPLIALSLQSQSVTFLALSRTVGLLRPWPCVPTMSRLLSTTLHVRPISKQAERAMHGCVRSSRGRLITQTCTKLPSVMFASFAGHASIQVQKCRGV
jgi:hypothetical protein